MELASTRRSKRFEYRYCGGLLLIIASLLTASLYDTQELWQVKIILVLFLLVSAAILLWQANRI